ncbi:hypothetical protein CBA19CS42_00995 [Caballeronia novacaledonica]|uniref:Uncharacterized protein n=1 Tax=Caballeronia novacaledonica TaxID=1544861 RepID=A0AA37MQH9_9BURK|nr:hypothetical protein CBA19CS42_00995 [Caballeronia novacaledonica]
MRLAAAERGLQLDDRIAAFAAQPLDDGFEQEAHAFGDEGALEEERGALIFGRGCAVVNTRQVRREFGLLEHVLPNVLVRNGDFTPGFQVHFYCPRED